MTARATETPRVGAHGPRDTGPIPTLPDGEGGERVYLLFEGNSDERSRIHDLPPTGQVVIGRHPAADVVVGDPSVSRRHASLTLRVTGVELVDLHSQNGTFVNGERINSRRILTSGDTITLGALRIGFQRETPGRTPRTVALPRLMARCREEVERSLRYRRPMMLLTIEIDDEDLDLARIESVVTAQLRLMDQIAWGASRRILALLPETGIEAAPAVARRLLEALAPITSKVRVGAAACPADGCDPDTLFANSRTAAVKAEVGRLATPGEASTTFRIGDMTVLAADPQMASVFTLIRQLAPTDLPVLICGETGVGKEIAARLVHAWSRRSGKAVVVINCAALPETLIESELFGYERGAFSGAVAAKPGLLEDATGGTVFLDEIGEMPVSAQAKLLRVLEAKRIARLGAVREHHIDIRIVAATNRDLEREVQAGRFRQDLYFRLGVATVRLPPLRERAVDLPLLARTFLEDACNRMARASLAISPAAMQQLGQHAWPGNVRELKNMMEYLAATLPGPLLDVRDLPHQIAAATGAHLRAPRSDSTTLPIVVPAPELDGGRLPAAVAIRPPPPPDARPQPGERSDFRNVYDELKEIERARMLAALASTNGVQSQAAQLIGMPRRTFVAKLRQYGIISAGEGRRRLTRES